MRRVLAIVASALVLAIGAKSLVRSASAQGAQGIVAMAIGSTNVSPGLLIFGVDSAGQLYAGQGCNGSGAPTASFIPVGHLPAGAQPTCMTGLPNGRFVYI